MHLVCCASLAVYGFPVTAMWSGCGSVQGRETDSNGHLTYEVSHVLRGWGSIQLAFNTLPGVIYLNIKVWVSSCCL